MIYFFIIYFEHSSIRCSLELAEMLSVLVNALFKEQLIMYFALQFSSTQFFYCKYYENQFHKRMMLGSLFRLSTLGHRSILPLFSSTITCSQFQTQFLKIVLCKFLHNVRFSFPGSFYYWRSLARYLYIALDFNNLRL